MATAAVVFALFVSSVEGRLVSRPGSPHAYLGAKVPGQEGGVIAWQPEVVIAVPEPDYLRYSREWDQLVRLGDLKKRTEAEFAAYSAALAKTEADREKKLAEEAKKLESEAKKAPSETPKAPSAGVQE
jgi:hypothetical protein